MGAPSTLVRKKLKCCWPIKFIIIIFSINFTAWLIDFTFDQKESNFFFVTTKIFLRIKFQFFVFISSILRSNHGMPSWCTIKWQKHLANKFFLTYLWRNASNLSFQHDCRVLVWKHLIAPQALIGLLNSTHLWHFPQGSGGGERGSCRSEFDSRGRIFHAEKIL